MSAKPKADASMKQKPEITTKSNKVAIPAKTVALEDMPLRERLALKSGAQQSILRDIPVVQAEALLKGPGNKRPMALLDQKEGPADVSRKRVKTAAQPKDEEIPKRKAAKKRTIVESSSEEISLQDDSDDHSQWDDDEEL